MQNVTRRQFMVASAAAVGIPGAEGSAKPASAAPQGPPGAMIFQFRKELMEDFDGTLRQVADIGYKVLEFCSPPGFVTMDMAPLVEARAADLRRKAEKAGLRFVSSHYQFSELKAHLDARIDYAKELGQEHMVIATYGMKKDANMDDWRKAAEDSNRLGERVKKAGLQLAFHNHQFEFERIDGVLIFDELMKHWDRDLVKSQFQVNVRGSDPAEVLEKYAGRIASLHLMDMKEGQRGRIPVGQGEIDWKKLFAAANKAEYQYYFVELPMEGIRASLPFLRTLK